MAQGAQAMKRGPTPDRERNDKVLGLLAFGVTYDRAARLLGLSRSTVAGIAWRAAASNARDASQPDPPSDR
jgi:hypothetical protein